ncbi:MAG: hypothetical protein K1X55_17105 [Chitinophagales bacterium]|nr:hypothetical protein [Chitinophagales bacterium]
MKVAFLGYDFFYGCIEQLVLDGHIFAWLFTYECDNKYNFNKKVLNLAYDKNAEIFVNKITVEDIKRIQGEGCDLIISAAYQYKIPVFDGMPKCINIHPSLLPEGRGPWPLPHIILKEIKRSGVTIHKVVTDFDAGQILIQEAFDISSNENLESLSCKSQIVAKRLTSLLLNDFNFYWENSKPQSGGEYWKAPTFDERTIKWTDTVEKIDRISRAFGKFDSFVEFDNKEWIVKDLTVWKEIHNFEIGFIVHKTNKEVVIAASDGFVCLRYFNIDPDFAIEKNIKKTEYENN